MNRNNRVLQLHSLTAVLLLLRNELAASLPAVLHERPPGIGPEVEHLTLGKPAFCLTRLTLEPLHHPSCCYCCYAAGTTRSPAHPVSLRELQAHFLPEKEPQMHSAPVSQV